LKKNLLIFFLGAAVIIALDQITKSAITSRFVLHESYPVIDGLFNLVYVLNPGAAFGFLADASKTFRYIFFIGISVVALLLIVYYLVKSNPRNLMLAGSLTLIFGGAVGNLIDRIRFGAVVDFLDVYVGSAHWPAFNVADSAIEHLQKQTHSKNDSFKVMNLNKLDFPDATFDVVFAFGVLGYCDDPFASFKELYRVCKPGGIIGLYSPEIGGMKKIFFQTLRAFCKGMNLEQKRRVAKLISPMYGLLPSNSKMSAQNADPEQLEEVIITNIAPPQLTFIPNAEIQNWYKAQSIEITSNSDLEKTTIWGKKK